MASKFFVMHMVVESRQVRSFPLDMLRYDNCVPATEADSNAIEKSINGDSSTHGVLRVTLRRFAVDNDRYRQRSALDRWLSFGWHVVDYKLLEVF